MTNEPMVEAILIGSAMKFKISKALAVLCFHCIGRIIFHDQLGPLLCEEIKLDSTDGSIQQIGFFGTHDLTTRLDLWSKMKKG